MPVNFWDSEIRVHTQMMCRLVPGTIRQIHCESSSHTLDAEVFPVHSPMDGDAVTITAVKGVNDNGVTRSCNLDGCGGLEFIKFLKFAGTFRT
jgi:hypothetical protein